MVFFGKSEKELIRENARSFWSVEVYWLESEALEGFLCQRNELSMTRDFRVNTESGSSA